MLTGQDGEDQALDLLASFEETAFHLRLEGLESRGLDHMRERLSARGAQIPFDGASSGTEPAGSRFTSARGWRGTKRVLSGSLPDPSVSGVRSKAVCHGVGGNLAEGE